MKKEKNTNSEPNITRFDYGRTAFSGDRLSISRGGRMFCRYYSDRECGGPKKARAAARKAKKAVLPILAESMRRHKRITAQAARAVEKILKR